MRSWVARDLDRKIDDLPSPRLWQAQQKNGDGFGVLVLAGRLNRQDAKDAKFLGID